MHSLVMANAIQSHARAEVSMISISIANRHYNTQKKYACHMKIILDTKSKKGQLY